MPGLACTWSKQPARLAALEPSHVLTAMGVPPDRARASIRFSLGKQNTQEDIEFALALIPETVVRLRELSPVYKKTALST